MKRSGWQCPACGRVFARAQQNHSCDPRSVDSHFDEKPPAVRRLFDTLVERLKKSGPFRVDAVKTSIHLVARHHFGGIGVRNDYLRVEFLAPRAIENKRIARIEVLGPRRVAHHVVIRTAQDIDKELLTWLKTAREMQS